MRIRKSIELEQENVEWFYKTYPNANISILMDTLLRYYREATEKTPEEYARIAIERLKNSGSVSDEG